MALAAQIATDVRHGEVVFFAIIEVMAAPTAHTTVEESYTGVYGQRHLELAIVAGCFFFIGHADRMVGHIAPPSHFLSATFVFSGYRSGYVIVATKASIGFRVYAPDKFTVILASKLLFACIQMSLGRKLPVGAFSGTVSGSLMA